MYRYFFLALFFCCARAAYCDVSYAISVHGDVKYKQNQSFAYVNPQAPKGGVITLGVSGTFNSLNPFTIKGDAPAGLSLFSERLVFESLMVRAADEPFTLYGLIAEKVDVAPDRRWVIFHLNPQAQWSDGHPITADDVMFSYETLRTDGKPILQLHYGGVESAEKQGPRSIKFTFKLKDGQTNPEMPMIMGLMPILPKHAFLEKDFKVIDFRQVPGSGPYRMQTVDMGKGISYERNSNYWGKNLAVRQGFYNFDEVKVIYFFEPHLVLEAFKGGHIDYVSESNPIFWHKNYDFPRVKTGEVLKIQYEHQIPMGMEGLVFNTRRPIFQDRNVRFALSLLLPFDELNKNLYGEGLKRYQSFFDNSELAAGDVVSVDEKNILQKIAPHRIDAILDHGKQLKTLLQTDERHRLKTAQKLLFDAGWRLKGGILYHQETNEPFKIQLLLYSSSHQRIALYFKKVLKKLGIDLMIRLVDGAQYEKRLGSYDFDMIVNFWGSTLTVGNEQKHYWTTKAAELPGTRNFAGIRDLAIDQCCDLIAASHQRKDLISRARVLDRLLLQGIYVIPLGYNKQIYAAHSRYLEHAAIDPRVGILLSTWWRKPEA